MPPDNILEEILKDTDYQLNLFTDEEIAARTAGVTFKEQRGKRKPHVKCVVRNKEIVLTPEEAIRQLFAAQLMDKYKYSSKRLSFEHSIHFGRSVKRADIVIMDKDRPDVEYIIVELKRAGWQKATQIILQCHRRAYGCLDEWQPDHLLPAQRPQLL